MGLNVHLSERLQGRPVRAGEDAPPLTVRKEVEPMGEAGNGCRQRAGWVSGAGSGRCGEGAHSGGSEVKGESETGGSRERRRRRVTSSRALGLEARANWRHGPAKHRRPVLTC